MDGRQKKMNKKFAILLIAAFASVAVVSYFVFCNSTSQNEDTKLQTHNVGKVPFTGNVLELPTPNTLVNDFACIFSKENAAILEDSLRVFAQQTTAQIAIVSVTNTGKDNPVVYAAKLGDKWGVGKKEKDNGVIILFLPKTKESKGEVAIATGRGLEEILPDDFCKRIITEKMIPHLKDGNDYYGATKAALSIIMPVIGGTYSYEIYKQEQPTK